MKGNEYDIFAELEHEMGRDLSQWRRHIVADFEKCRAIAYDMEKSASGSLELADPAARERIKSRILDFFIVDWIENKESPGPGDLISVTGQSYWHVQDEASGETVTRRLPLGHKIEGALLHLDVLPYIDEAGLAVQAHMDPEQAYQHTHWFGLHLILDNPTITNDVGTPLPAAPKRLYLPIHYEQAMLRVY